MNRDQKALRLLRCAFLCFIAVAPIAMDAQIKPSRTWLVDMARRPALQGVLPSMMGGAEMYRSWGSYQHEQAWQLRVHAVVEPYRFIDVEDSNAIQWTSSLEFHQELTANPMNDIGFNPRTARWEEQLLIHASGSWWSARAGWFHRCKHDIDNTESPNDAEQPDYSPVRRTLILSGPSLGALTQPITSGDWSFRLAGGAEWYVVNDDYRSPSTSLTGSWTGMQGALWFRGDATVTVATHFLVGARYYISLPWFSNRYGAPNDIVVPHDARAELFGTLFSHVAAMDIVVSAEHTFDEVAYLNAMPSTYLQIGLRFRSR